MLLQFAKKGGYLRATNVQTTKRQKKEQTDKVQGSQTEQVGRGEEGFFPKTSALTHLSELVLVSLTHPTFCSNLGQCTIAVVLAASLNKLYLQTLGVALERWLWVCVMRNVTDQSPAYPILYISTFYLVLWLRSLILYQQAYSAQALGPWRQEEYGMKGYPPFVGI